MRLQQSHADGGQLDKERRSMLEKLSAAELVNPFIKDSGAKVGFRV